MPIELLQEPVKGASAALHEPAAMRSLSVSILSL